MRRRFATALRFAPLLATALGLVLTVRVGLWATSHRSVRKAFLPPRRVTPDRMPPLRVIWAVRHAARLVPKASCLTQALAAQILLARRGVPSTITLGVHPEQGTRFEAHAWLELDGRAVLGGTDESLAGFARLTDYSVGQPTSAQSPLTGQA